MLLQAVGRTDQESFDAGKVLPVAHGVGIDDLFDTFRFLFLFFPVIIYLCVLRDFFAFCVFFLSALLFSPPSLCHAVTTLLSSSSFDVHLKILGRYNYRFHGIHTVHLY